MLQRSLRRLAVAVAAPLAFLCPAAAVPAQTGPCCMPDGTWLTTSPYHCHVSGGVYKVGGETISTPCDPVLGPGVSMSQTAVRRLVRQGVIHTLWTTELSTSAEALWASTDPTVNDMWNLLASGAVIAPQLHVDLRNYDTSSIAANAEAAAADVISRVQTAKAGWDTAHPTLPFYWALRLQNLGQSHRFEEGAASMLATFSNHEDDLPTSVARVPQKDYIAQGGGIASVSGSSFVVHADNRAFFGQFDNQYYTSSPATVTIDGSFSALITGFNPSSWTFTLDAAVPSSAAAFTISRGDATHPNRGLLPCYFFHHGSLEVEEWVTTFCDYITTNAPTLPEPVAVVVGTEDVGEVSID